MAVFAEQKFHEFLFGKPSLFTRFFPLLYLLAILFLIFAILDVIKGKEEIKATQNFRNVMFLLDVSNSMNAEDVAPDRLTVAKNIVVHTLAEIPTTRAGVVVFAGDARSIMPLTTDYTAVENYIRGIETSMLKVQGTDFMKAMKEVSKKLKSVPEQAREVILISDGEDNEEQLEAAITLAKEEGLRVITVGVGTEEGAPVPEYLYGQLMGYKTDMTGETVITTLQTQALESIAKQTGGKYIHAQEPQDAARQIVADLKTNIHGFDVTMKSENSKRYYQYFLAITLLFLFIIYLLNPQKDFNT